LTLLVLTPVLSHLLALALGFELQVGGSENISLISGVVLWPHTPVVSRRYLTFGGGEQGHDTSEGMIKVSICVTFKCVELVKPLGFLLFALCHVCRVSFVCSLALMHEFRGSLCA
jgi:hypothetical protein